MNNVEVDKRVMKAVAMDIDTAKKIVAKVFAGVSNHKTCRAIDQSLQRLKRAGKIKWASHIRRWRLA